MAWRVKSGKYLAVLVCLVGAVCSESNEAEFNKDHPTLLVEKIRRQLMNDNYDYMPSESEDMFSIKHELGNETVAPDSPAVATTEGKDIANNELDSNINDEFIMRAREQSAEDVGNDKSHPICKKDLLYYVDEHRLDQKAAAASTDEHRLDQKAAAASTDETTTPIVKYSLLKVKQPHANRRNGKGFYRRFIQEEGEQGVAIMNLDDEPFPEFRLPKSRRQYMMDRDDFDSSLEAAALTDFDDDPLVTNFERFDDNYKNNPYYQAT